MPPALARCAALRPTLFWWAGAPDPDRLRAAVAALGADVPPDLLAFWSETGGGEMFESEDLLSPLGSTDLLGGVAEQTAWHRTLGLPPGLLFHEGGARFCSAVRSTDGRYVTLRRDYVVAEAFGSFDEWFRVVLLSEYAERYGLLGVV